jgi:hypothetical protein
MATDKSNSTSYGKFIYMDTKYAHEYSFCDIMLCRTFKVNRRFGGT